MCDAHHLVHRADGGPTTLHDLVLLCRGQHVLWHRGTIDVHDLHVPWQDAPVPPRPLADLFSVSAGP